MTKELTRAQIHEAKHGAVTYPYEERDERGNVIYREYINQYIEEFEYDERDNKIRFESCDGDSWKKEYDEWCREVYFRDRDGNETYAENNNGVIHGTKRS